MRSRGTDLGRAKAPAGQRGTAEKTKPKRLNQAGRPTATELERRKGRVMDVATDLFVGRGYAATSLVDIAKGAGVATRTLYQHFGDKEAMFREVIFARDIGAVIPPPTLEPDDTLVSALRRTARYAIDVSLRQRSVDLMRLMVAESHRFPEFMQKVATSIFARFRRNIAKIFEAAAARGLVADGDHARSAELFADLILGNTPIMTYTNWQTAPPTDQDLDDRVALFIRGRFGGDTVTPPVAVKPSVAAKMASGAKKPVAPRQAAAGRPSAVTTQTAAAKQPATTKQTVSAKSPATAKQADAAKPPVAAKQAVAAKPPAAKAAASPKRPARTS